MFVRYFLPSSEEMKSREKQRAAQASLAKEEGAVQANFNCGEHSDMSVIQIEATKKVAYKINEIKLKNIGFDYLLTQFSEDMIREYKLFLGQKLFSELITQNKIAAAQEMISDLRLFLSVKQLSALVSFEKFKSLQLSVELTGLDAFL